MTFLSAAMQSNSRLFKPHKYQSDGIKWLLKNPYSGLFLPPGLGKTAIVLSAFRIMKHKGIVNKMLVIAPLRVCHMVWPYEIEKWDNFEGLSIGILHGKDKHKTLSEDHDIFVVNPDGLRWLAVEIGRKHFMDDKLKWMLTIDESSNFKNGTSQRFKTLKNLLKKFNRRTILTGTPAPNGLINLWSQLYLVDQGARLGSYITQFRNTYFNPAGWQGYSYEIQRDGAERIYGQIDDVVLHKNADELDLPALINNTITIQLPTKIQTLYREMKEELVAFSEGNLLTAVNSAVLSGKLRQIANGGVYDEAGAAILIHDEKTKAVQDIAEELGGRPLLVMYEFRHDLQRLQTAFPDAPRLGGGVSMEETKGIIRQWNNSELPVLFLHPASAGHGLNLQGGTCHDICWHSIPWDLELYLQAIARVWRQGVKNTVTVHHIVAQGTIDRRIVRVLTTKGNVQHALLDALLK